jgi:uncharacterized protein YbjT (DUF2867 family)
MAAEPITFCNTWDAAFLALAAECYHRIQVRPVIYFLTPVPRRAGVKKIVLVTSIGVDDPFFPLNLFWGVLFWKKRGEEAVQRSGIDYTIVRPGASHL